MNPGPKSSYTPEIIKQAYDLYFVHQIGRQKAAKEMDLRPAVVVYLANLHKKRLASQGEQKNA